ncbi:MAG: hypothetical protein CVU56_25565 [Deltaproteobacteria bacterium HGW-Deltaproteobacteria-14]|nr:MAG: hypothetical protein CVU56_25565 [Deltaproteobacteria bacterium HGW-Deltaproteobacteria-14]
MTEVSENPAAAYVARIKAGLEGRIRDFAVTVQRALPGASVTTHLLATASFPWWAVVSVCRNSGARDEVVVLDVAYWRNPARCQLSCDLSTGGGVVLRELPEQSFDPATLTTELLDGWIARTIGFIEDNVATTVAVCAKHGL